jgi:hypothetical protein
MKEKRSFFVFRQPISDICYSRFRDRKQAIRVAEDGGPKEKGKR